MTSPKRKKNHCPSIPTPHGRPGHITRWRWRCGTRQQDGTEPVTFPLIKLQQIPSDGGYLSTSGNIQLFIKTPRGAHPSEWLNYT